MEKFGGFYHKGPDFKEGEPNMRKEFRKLDGTIEYPFNPKIFSLLANYLNLLS